MKMDERLDERDEWLDESGECGVRTSLCVPQRNAVMVLSCHRKMGRLVDVWRVVGACLFARAPPITEYGILFPCMAVSAHDKIYLCVKMVMACRAENGAK
uniref:Uncharacterized protein n=1 Tax=Eutreptiella gymnastica TaxID=73025 RepID=A0A7S1ITC5_9EUGL